MLTLMCENRHWLTDAWAHCKKRLRMEYRGLLIVQTCQFKQFSVKHTVQHALQCKGSYDSNYLFTLLCKNFEALELFSLLFIMKYPSRRLLNIPDSLCNMTKSQNTEPNKVIKSYLQRQEEQGVLQQMVQLPQCPDVSNMQSEIIQKIQKTLR